MEAGDVRVGDEALRRDGRVVEVESVRVSLYDGLVYNLSAAELQCYSVRLAGVLVHNTNGTEPTRPMNRAEARAAAAGNGWREVINPPFNPHGQPAFTDGKTFFTPDADSHIGGVWKQFSKQGNRLGTLDAGLNRIGK